jgi:prepilin-type N-terminal cleavage/methylation domain-containing protein
LRRPISSSTGSAASRGHDDGFTLVEVMVALAIAGGSLVLILTANNASLRRSVESNERARVELAAESKLDEILLGMEPGWQGDMPGMPGWRWSLVREPTFALPLKKLRQMTFRVFRPDGSAALEWKRLQYGQ